MPGGGGGGGGVMLKCAREGFEAHAVRPISAETQIVQQPHGSWPIGSARCVRCNWPGCRNPSHRFPVNRGCKVATRSLLQRRDAVCSGSSLLNVANGRLLSFHNVPSHNGDAN